MNGGGHIQIGAATADPAEPTARDGIGQDGQSNFPRSAANNYAIEFAF